MSDIIRISKNEDLKFCKCGKIVGVTCRHGQHKKNVDPWNKGTKGLQVSWNKGNIGYHKGHIGYNKDKKWTKEQKDGLTVIHASEDYRRKQSESHIKYVKIETICDFCGLKIKRREGKLFKHNFCSMKCKGLWMKKKPSWNKGLKGEQSHSFGHEVSETTRNKIGDANRGENNGMFNKPSPMRNKKHTEESRQKNRLSHLDKKINLSEEGKKKKRETAMKNLPKLQASDKHYESPVRKRKLSEKAILRWSNPKWKEMVLKKVFESNDRKPNNTEKFVTSKIQDTLPNEYIFSGAGEIFIAGKCPDWFNINGKKKVVELFGNYFHSEKVTGRTKEQEEKQRIDHFKKYGYDCLIIWELELKNMEALKQKLIDFNNS